MSYAFQNSRDKQKFGSKAPWYAAWTDVDGKKHTLKVGAKKKDATEIAQERERNAKRAASGLTIDKGWLDFREEYERLALPNMPSARSRDAARQALDMFEKIVNPKLVQGVSRKTFDQFVAKRRTMRGKKKGDKVAAATMKKELRTIRAALSFAVEWGYLQHVPKLPKVDGFETEKRYITPEDFDKMLSHLHVARFPNDQAIEPWQWWDALLSLLWVAPNRITSMLMLRWENVDLEQGTVTSRAVDTKQKKYHRASVPVVVLEKLEAIRRFDPRVFPWNHSESTLFRQFDRIQAAAGIHLACDGDHEHTDACHAYGFHDFRRSFATLNGELPVAFQQNQMGHSTYATTMRYVGYGKEQRTYADQLHLPESMLNRAESV